MITYRFPATAGTPWDDLDDDRPWFDPAAEADRRQDVIAADAAAALVAVLPAAALVALERFGPGALVAVEADALPGPEPFSVPAVYPSTVVPDDDFVRYRRRRALNRALDEPTAVPYRREQVTHARTRKARDLAG